MEVPVGVIFDYDDVVFHAESVDGFSAGQAEDAGCGVLADSGTSVSLETFEIGGQFSNLRDGVH